MNKIDMWITADGLLLIRGWRRSGLTEAQIAEKIGIKLSTLKKWRRNNPKLEKAMQSKRDRVDLMVESALLKKALGYESTETKTVIKANGDEEVTTMQKQVPPDYQAASLWLKNRCPDTWSDKPSRSAAGAEKKLDKILKDLDDAANR